MKKNWILSSFAAAMVAVSAAQAAKPSGLLKIEPIPQNAEEISKKQEERESAVNKALAQALNERAKSHTDFERNPAVGRREIDLRELRGERLNSRRAEMNRDLRDETKREKRLNWLGD